VKNASSTAQFSTQKLRIQSILASKPQTKFTISSNSTVLDAVSLLTNSRNSSAIVMNEKDNEVLGIFTTRDILRHIQQAAGSNKLNNTTLLGQCFTHPVTSIMTPKDKMVDIYISLIQ
jgi:CBS domain-containing protein